MKRVGFVLGRGKGEADPLLHRLLPVLKARGAQALVARDPALHDPSPVDGIQSVPAARLADEVDFLVVLGGDGTLLHAAGMVADRPIPLLGINLGRLGFLTAFDDTEAESALEQALDGSLAVEQRMRLEVTLRRRSGEIVTHHALNDAVVSQGELARLIELDTTVDGHPVALYQADGLIVATPTGSTAYNLAAGGPIITPGHQGIVLTPICPHALTNRPLVIGAGSRVSMALGGRTATAVLTVDGQWALRLAKGDTVTIARAPVPLSLYHANRSFFDILRVKLGWGERPGKR